jgi:hypothetical protein
VGTKQASLYIHTSFDTHLLTTGYETAELKLTLLDSADGPQLVWQSDMHNTKLMNEQSRHTKRLRH